MLNFDVMPEQASTYAEKLDPLIYLLVTMTVVGTALVLFLVCVLSWKFRAGDAHERPSQGLENVALEIVWTVLPTILFLAIFGWGLSLYFGYLKVPEGALEIDVVGKQWMWKIQHPNGMREVNELHVPIGEPVKLTMTSQDVLHDFYVPAFRVKQDVLPGRFTSLWFEATKVGAYHLFCAEYCGTEHSLMGGTVYVMEPEDYVEWLEGGPKETPQKAGEFLFAQRGCATCHTDKPGSRGPSLTGIFGHSVQLTKGETVIADEQYLSESIMEPGKRIVEGYAPLMPSFKNQITPEDVNNLIAYIKSLTEDTASTN